jgi:hypothetical protein
MILPMKNGFGRIGCGWLLLLVLFLGADPLNAAKNRTSFMLECNGSVTFHVVGVDGLQPKQELVLSSQGGGPIDWRVYLPEKAWKEVFGERCSGVGKCEIATSARIWIENEDANRKLVSGRYEVGFGEQHFQGQFVAEFKKHKFVCE